jgi:hypothetical protein
VDNAYYYAIRALVHLSECADATDMLTDLESAAPSSPYLADARDYVGAHC